MSDFFEQFSAYFAQASSIAVLCLATSSLTHKPHQIIRSSCLLWRDMFDILDTGIVSMVAFMTWFFYLQFLWPQCVVASKVCHCPAELQFSSNCYGTIFCCESKARYCFGLDSVVWVLWWHIASLVLFSCCLPGQFQTSYKGKLV